jgi:hypothetical protein
MAMCETGVGGIESDALLDRVTNDAKADTDCVQVIKNVGSQTHIQTAYNLRGDYWVAMDCAERHRYICGFPREPELYIDESELTVPLTLMDTNASLRYIAFSFREAWGAGGSQLGALICKNSDLHIEYADFSRNVQQGLGAGAIYIDSSHLDMSFCHFDHNQNLGRGAGAMYIVDSTVKVTHMDFIANQATNMNGVDAYTRHHTAIAQVACILMELSTAAVEHCSFKENIGDVTILASRETNLTVAFTSFEKNAVSHVPSYDSSPNTCLVVREASSASITSTSFIANEGASAGALAIAERGRVHMYDAYFYMNKATFPSELFSGGAVRVSSGAVLSTEACTFEQNVAYSSMAGGGILVLDAMLTLAASVITGNLAHAAVAAGGVAASGSTIVMTGSNVTVNNIRADVDGTFSTGGGGFYSVESHCSILASSIRDNGAKGPDGTSYLGPYAADQFYMQLPKQVYLLDSVVAPVDGSQAAVINPGLVSGKMAGGCAMHPCSAGSECSYDNYSLSCQACKPGSQSSDGITCRLCPQGFGPLVTQAGCSACSGDNISTFGVCQPCASTLVVNDKHTLCEDCGVRQTATPGPAEKRVCGCEAGYVNTTSLVRVCFHGGFDTARVEQALVMHSKTGDQACDVCPTDILENPCLVCKDGVATISPGFTVPPIAETVQKSRRSLLEDEDVEVQTVFRCHVEVRSTSCQHP